MAAPLPRELLRYKWWHHDDITVAIYRPDVQRFVEKKEKEEREKREGKDDRSFFQKYVSTHIISPLLINFCDL